MLKVFTNHTDTVVAESLADTQALLEEQYGTTFEAEGWSIDEWSEVRDDHVITICNVDDKGPDSKKTLTAAEWAKSEGRGLLCSTEW